MRCTHGDEAILSTETVESATGSLEGIDDVERSDGFAVNIPISVSPPPARREHSYAPLGVLSVGNGGTNDVLEEDLEDTTSLFVDETGDTLHTTSASETTDSGLSDT